MLVVALTGGIGSGKSEVSALFAEFGAVVVDADVIAREVVRPGTPALQAIVERFGPGVLRQDGSLDRQALAGLVFDDPEALAALNGIVHPAVRDVIAERLRAEAGTDHVVVLVIPLLVESRGDYPVAGVVVVDAPEDLAARRLARHRGMDEEDVRRRMAAQASRSDRLAVADFVIRNDGSLDDLRREAERAWKWVLTLPAGRPPGG